MKVTRPLTITDAMLVASSVPEVPPAAFAASTTYGAGATVSVGVAGETLAVYQSLQAGNVGHAPAGSPTWWRYIGDTYAVYDVNATYGLGARVIDPVAHVAYESRMAANKGQTLTTGTAWLKLGPTNKWKAFDQLRNTQTEAPVDIVMSIAPGERVGAISLIGLDASKVTVTVAVQGVEKYRSEVSLKLRRSHGWRDFFYGRFSYRKSVQLLDLPLYRNAVITVTVSKSVGQRKVGGILIGNAIYIGEMQYKPRSDHLNFSEVDRNEFGDIQLQPRRSVPKLNGIVEFDKSLTRRILDLREELNGVPAVWSGLDDFTLDYFEPLFIYGIHKEFSISLEGPKEGTITLEVEEL